MKMDLFNIANFRIDGGAMFGVVPKLLWSRVYASDENNLMVLTLRSLVVETAGHVILVDTGWGEKHDENVECCTLKMTPRGIRLNEKFSFKEIY